MTDSTPNTVADAAPTALPARVVYDVAPDILAMCGQALADGARAFDLSACADFDSSLIGILLELERQAATLGGAVRLLDPPPKLRELAQLYGVDDLLFESRGNA